MRVYVCVYKPRRLPIWSITYWANSSPARAAGGKRESL